MIVYLYHKVFNITIGQVARIWTDFSFIHCLHRSSWNPLGLYTQPAEYSRSSWFSFV